jgi:hypothetical protein
MEFVMEVFYRKKWIVGNKRNISAGGVFKNVKSSVLSLLSE